MSNYQTYLVETFRNPGEPSNAQVRVRPLPGQGVPTDLRVACRRDMRHRHPVGTIFKIKAARTQKEGGRPFLYSSYRSPYIVVERAEAGALIKQKEISSSELGSKKKRKKAVRKKTKQSVPVQKVEDDGIEKDFQGNLIYCGNVVALKGTYYVFEAQKNFLCLYISFVKPSTARQNYYRVSKTLVQYVRTLLKERDDITVSWLGGRIQRSRHNTDRSGLRCALYILTVLGEANMAGPGKRGELHFSGD